jgi:hypothetical protein
MFQVFVSFALSYWKVAPSVLNDASVRVGIAVEAPEPTQRQESIFVRLYVFVVCVYGVSPRTMVLS